MEGQLNLGVHERRLNADLPPLRHSGWNGRFNASGFLTYTNRVDAPQTVVSYSQCFRFGGVEGYSALFSSDREGPGGHRARRLFASQLRKSVQEFVDNAITVMQDLFELEPPFGVMLTLVHVEGCVIPALDGYHVGRPIDVAELRPPATIVESGQDPHAAMRYAYDILWQASGFPGAPAEHKVG
jgi:hypothetical protein